MAASASRLNHVSVSAADLERSGAFYVELFGAEPLATPNFGYPVRWLGLGDTQLHLFQSGDDAPSRHHFALAVEDLEPVYRRAAALDAFDTTAFGHHLYELPGDIAQLYLRDPGGNLVEVNCLGAGGLPDALGQDMRRLADVHPQSDDNLSARLYLHPAGEPSAPRY